MEPIEKQLLAVVDELIEKNKKLYDLFRQERSCVTHFDINGLRTVNADEMQLSVEISDLNQQRLHLVMQLKEKYQVTEMPVTLAVLTRYVPQPYAAYYEERAAYFKKLLADIIRCRNLNNRLIEKAIRFNERHIQLYIKAGDKKLTYDNTGTINHSRRQMLDSVV